MTERASTALYVATKENQKIHYRPSLREKNYSEIVCIM